MICRYRAVTLGVTAIVLTAVNHASAQEVRVFQIDPSIGQSVNWSADSNLGPMGAFLQSYSFFGDVSVDFDLNPSAGLARITEARLRVPNTVVAAVLGGSPATVAYRDLVLDASSPDFQLFPTFPFATFSTDLDLSVSSGFVLISPPVGPALQFDISGTSLGSIPVAGSFPLVGPTYGMRVGGFSFDLNFLTPGFFGTFTHDVVELSGTSACPEPLPYCPPDPSDPNSGARLGHIGSTSVAADDFNLAITNAPANNFGVVFYGPIAAEVGSGNGTLCVGGPLTRVSLILTNGAGGATLPIPLGPLQSTPNPLAPGTHQSFQYWHREAPLPPGSTWSYSNALAVTFCP